MDLKDAYFHLPLGENLKSFVRIKVTNKIWEFQGACFGLSPLPQVFMLLMKTFLRKWRSEGLICFVYLDDILLLATKKNDVKTSSLMGQDFVRAGMKKNIPKSVLEPVQTIQHLGFIIDLKGELKVPSQSCGR